MPLFKLLLLILIFCTISCNKDDFTPLEMEFIDDYRNLARTVNHDFQFALFKEVNRRSKKGSNQIVSPISLSMALGMLYHGARSETQKEISHLLGYDDMEAKDVLDLQKSQLIYLQGLDQEANFIIGNALFYDPDRIMVKQEFLDINANHNQAFTEACDFDQPHTLQKINTWIDDATNGKIRKLIEGIEEEDVMLILNTLYFEGGWNKPFDPKKTQKTRFHPSFNDPVEVDMMFTENVLSGFVGENFQAFEIALGNKHFSVSFVLPNGDVDEWIEKTDPSGFDAIFDQMYLGNFRAGLPKFEISSKHHLKEVLKTLGLKTAFEPQADYSALGVGPKGRNVELSRSDQATYFKVDEEGVKAGASSSLVPIVVSESQTILLDRPFIFALRDRSTNAMLFIGKVENPNLHN